jgi:hypothetical protein
VSKPFPGHRRVVGHKSWAQPLADGPIHAEKPGESRAFRADRLAHWRVASIGAGEAVNMGEMGNVTSKIQPNVTSKNVKKKVTFDDIW